MCKIPFLRCAYWSLLIRLVKRTGLFDAEHYLAVNPDVSRTLISPLRHYVAYGDREGRTPMPFFEPSFYRYHTRGPLKKVNALLHYAYVGRFFRLSPSTWFDVGYYLAHNKDVARAGIDPLLHYLRRGGLEGRSPCAQFDGAHYMRDNPGVAAARVNPLLHYLRFGRYEGRQCQPADQIEASETGGDLSPPTLPREEDWLGLTPRAGIAQADLDVVVPVYQGRAETLRCLYSVLAATGATSFELVVIDDACPEAELAGDLRRHAGQGLFTLMVNEKNRGFVHTVNLGMGLHPNRDVVLLNSDTEVYDGWLDRLRQAAQRNTRTATVTPLSNNATICSYPHFLHDNPFPLEIGYDELDALAATVNAGVEVEAPTAVGFCMYVKRACLEEVGLFDEKEFGRGYGEENDFCRKAIKEGWRHVIAADLFVHHWGSTSFQGEKAKRIQAALKTLDRLHPNYRKDVAWFIEHDPLFEARSRLDDARLQHQRRDRNVLIVCHNRGGGTERHVQEDVQQLTGDGFGVFLLRPKPGQPSHAVLSHPVAKSLPNKRSFALADTRAWEKVLRGLGITEIQTHSLVDLEPKAPDHLIALARALGARLEINLHDYKVICPRINLVDGSGRYCGELIETYCGDCLAEQGSDFGVTDIAAWRAMHRRVLLAAHRVLVPDLDVAERLGRYFPEVRFTVSPHEELDPARITLRMPQPAPREKLRVVVIGAIGRIKGFDVLLACARDARARRLPLEFIVMGYGMNDRLLQEAGVGITGRYLEENAQATLSALSPHLVWLPSVWPETYSYTLSIALQAGLPVAAFDLGAIARRLRELDLAEGLMPLAWADRPEEINNCFLAYAQQETGTAAVSG